MEPWWIAEGIESVMTKWVSRTGGWMVSSVLKNTSIACQMFFHVGGGRTEEEGRGVRLGKWTQGILNVHCVLYWAMSPAATQHGKLQCLFFSWNAFLREIYFIHTDWIISISIISKKISLLVAFSSFMQVIYSSKFSSSRIYYRLKFMEQ